MAELRASDRDREDAAAALAAHCAEGRIDATELDRRVEAVYAASTQRDLDAVLGDLPATPAAGAGGETAPSRRRRRWFMPGIHGFEERVALATAPETAFDEALSTIVPALGRAGYHLVGMERPRMMRFVMRTAPDWALAAAVVTFGIGLLAFALRVDRPLTVMFLPGPRGGTRIVAFGEAPGSVRRAFAELRD